MSLFQLNSHPITNLRWQIIDEDKKFPGYFQVKILDETIEIADRCLIKKINDEMDLLSGYDAPPETVKRERLMKARQTTSRNIKYIAEQFSAHSYGDERNPSLEIGRWIGKFQAVNEFINQREFAETTSPQPSGSHPMHDAAIRRRRCLDGVLDEAGETVADSLGLAPIEAEDELVEVVLQVLGPDGAVVGAQ